MFTQLSFFVSLLGLSLGFLSYKVLVQRFPSLAVTWWSYSFTILLLGITSWMFTFGPDWRQPTMLFVLYYSIFILVRRRKSLKWLGILLTLAPLLLVKTGVQPFFAILGLSFVTFRAVDALLMNKDSDSIDTGDYFLYLFFPPALLAGPMYRWRVFTEDLAGAYSRLSVNAFLDGWEYVLLGIVQKFAFAQLVDLCVLQRVAVDDYSLFGATANALGYSAFLYFDFAGYSNMAIGAAALFGFRLPMNFNNPIVSSSPQDFWRRWHVSLSEWLRDVVFSPLYKYLLTKGGFGDRKLAAQNICILTTLLIMGTWNGLEPRYICSGIMFGLYSVGYNSMLHLARAKPSLSALTDSKKLQSAGRLLTLVLVIVALYVFSGRSPIG